MRLLYKYLYKLIKSLILKVNKFSQYLYWQEQKIQMKHQTICKHKHIKEDSFMGNRIYVCKDCKAFGNLKRFGKDKT